MAHYIPDGWHTVTPRLIVSDVPRMVEFLKQAFGATGELRSDRPSELKIGDSMVMVSEVGVRSAMPAFFYLYVADCDAVYQRALAAGAESLEAPENMPYGDRRCMVQDPYGSVWQIATHNEAAFREFLRQR